MTDYIEFAAKIKEKYPQYKDVDDLTLAQKVIEKYPEYKEKVTFESVKDSSPKAQTEKKKGIDLTPSGLYKGSQDLIASALAAPAIANKKGISLGEAYSKNRDVLSQKRIDNPTPIQDLILDLAGYMAIPTPNAKAAGLARAGQFLGQAALQGGVPAALETLKQGGNVAGGAGIGTGIAAALQGIAPVVAKTGKLLEKPAKYITNKAIEGLTDLKPETIAQVIRPTSKALDLTENEAQNLLMNTTEGVRDNYKNLIQRRGDAVGNLLKELPEDKAFKAEQLMNNYDAILNNYSLSKNQALNPARNATQKEMSKIEGLLGGNMPDIAKAQNKITPKELYDINKNISNMIDWDKPGAALKNDILEQIYLSNAKKLSNLSPELATANKAYSDLMDFQKNEGIRRIINNQNNIDTASSALKNYNSTVTKGNTNRNIQDLEKLLVNEGYEPFLNNIDDVNAAMDLLTQPKTGRNFLGTQTLAKGLVTPVLKAVREADKTGALQKLQGIKEILNPIGKLIKTGSAKGAADMLYGGVEYKDYQ